MFIYLHANQIRQIINESNFMTISSQISRSIKKLRVIVNDNNDIQFSQSKTFVNVFQQNFDNFVEQFALQQLNRAFKLSFAIFAKKILNFSLATKQLLDDRILSIMINQLIDNFESLKNSIFSTIKIFFFDERTLVSNTLFFDKYCQNDISKSKNILSNIIDVNILDNLIRIHQN